MRAGFSASQPADLGGRMMFACAIFFCGFDRETASQMTS